jgi:ribonuclease HII
MADFALETEAGGVVVGLDEAGRGPWAGPVVAAAVHLDQAVLPEELLALDDSKKLSPAKRDALFTRMQESSAVRIGLGQASAAEIDELNILQATFLAMRRALDDLGLTPDWALVDGNRAPPLPCKVRTVIGGDSLSLSIAAASIAAKVTRDRLMVEFDRQFPGYGFARHKGYGTAHHQDALFRLGPSAAHRRSFRPVGNACDSLKTKELTANPA